jgi:hypothetical protein
MRRKLMVLAAAASMALLVSGVAAASITLFEVPLFQTERRRRFPLEELFPWDD